MSKWDVAITLGWATFCLVLLARQLDRIADLLQEIRDRLPPQD